MSFLRSDYTRVALLGVLFLVPFLGGVHLFDWDEINFAECAREMLLTGDYLRPQIDYEPFFEKPPLFIWMQALSMQVFGVNEFAARFPNAVAGIIVLLLSYHMGRRLHDRMFGWLWVLAWLGSILPHLYFRSGIIDPWFNLFIFLGLWGFIEFRWLFFTRFQGRSFWRRYRYLLLGGWALGLGILTKGPVAYLIVFLVLMLYWAKYKFRNRGFLSHFILFSLAAFSVSALWFGVETLLHGPKFVQEFVAYQIRLLTTADSGHGGFLGYHVVVLLLGCFPISVFALPNLWGDRQPEDEVLESHTLRICQRSDLTTWMQLLFWVVLIVFSLVRTKIVHYSSLAYYPLTYLGAYTIWRAIHWDVRPRVVAILLPTLGVLIGGVQMLLPWLGQNTHLLRPLLAKDPFALARLEVTVDWHWYHALPGAILVVGVLLGLRLWLRSKPWTAAQIVFSAGALFVALTLVLCIGNIERYSQGSTIDFYKSKAHEDCFIKTVGFKSYAHLFYPKKPPVKDPTVDEYANLAYGNPGKTVYFVAKMNRLEELPTLPNCRELYRKHGMVYFVRQAP
ncbi:MAG: glycosyltransferase family 39 protein [Saprospiraceae bacterium]|nr:glycosyltransferase family 39 protein [Saprospiraceae bacterium]MDW8228817.1 glycosyltransferase family 39 protein [Saprospiraceae bacterium]